MTVTLPFLMLLVGVAPAAARDHDPYGWTNVGVEAEVSRQTTVQLREELRVSLRDGEVDELNTLLGFGHAATDVVGLAAHYRLDVEGWQGDPVIDHRFGLDAQATHRWGRADVSLRQRLQPELSSSVDDPARLVLRTRVRARARVSDDVQPYVAVEPYLALTTPEATLAMGGDRMRYDVGLSLLEGGLDLSYRLDAPLVPDEAHRHIVTLGFTGRVPPAP